MNDLYPLRFRPILKQYIWGGRRFQSVLGRQLGPGPNYAESWEICDRADDQSIVSAGPLAGTKLRDLVGNRGPELLGRHHPQGRFPLLLKFLDAAKSLSVQVHPNDEQAALLAPPDTGKSEAWVVMAAEPGGTIYAGLKAGVDCAELETAIRQGRCETCLHAFQAAVGDCVFLPAGTVHALGAGLLVAEVQQPSDTTYRLSDWNRLGTDGKPRELHIEQGLAVVDFARGPVGPRQPRPTGRPSVDRLLECEKFVVDRRQFERVESIGGDRRCHIIAVLRGAVEIEGDAVAEPLTVGGTVLLPASLGEISLKARDPAVLLDAYLP